MPFDFARAFDRAEELVRRHIKPKHVTAAEKRRSQRRTRIAMRRLTRAASVTGASGAGVFGYGLAVAPLGTGALVAAGAATLMAAGGAMFWPARRAGEQKIRSWSESARRRAATTSSPSKRSASSSKRATAAPRSAVAGAEKKVGDAPRESAARNTIYDSFAGPDMNA